MSSAESTALPITIDDLTPAWFSGALARRYPGVKVTAVEIVEVKQSTSTKIGVRLGFNEAGRDAGLPERLIVKGCFDEGRRPLTGVASANEALFYERIAPELDVEVASCFFAAGRPAERQGIILLEDLTARGCRFGRGSDSTPLATVRELIDLQASLHARWWNASIPGSEGFDRGDTIRLGAEFLVNPENWDPHLLREGRKAIQAGIPARLRGRDRAERAIRVLLGSWKKGPQCLLHGDFHPGNLYYRADGRPGVLDWQLWIGPWAHDFAYAVVGLLETDVRRECERDLLRRYLDRLSALGVEAPGFEEAWLAYRKHVIWGFLWIACPESMQPEDVIVTQAERFAKAAVDLDTFGALIGVE